MYMERFFGNSEREIGGLYVKIPGIKEFCLVQDITPTKEDKDILKITLTIPKSDLPSPAPAEGWSPGQYYANYFVHRTQAVFRTIEYHPAP